MKRLQTWTLMVLVTSSGCATPAGTSCASLSLQDSKGAERAFEIPRSRIFNSEVIEGVRKSIVFDLPYPEIASQQLRLRPEREWKHSSSVMVILDTRLWIESPQRLMEEKLGEARFLRGSRRRVYGMTEYVAVGMEGDRRETVYYPDDLSQGIWEINCLGAGEPYHLRGCGIHGEYRPGVPLEITMPAGHLPEYMLYWDRAKEVVASLEAPANAATSPRRCEP
jgi:hypothetical protein